MNKGLLITGFFLSLLLLSGCSQVQYLTGVESYNPQTGWQCKKSDHSMSNSTYQDSLISFSVSVYSEPLDNFYAARFILCGPPLIPIIPNVHAIFQSDYIRMGFDILWNPDSLLYDAEKIHLVLEDGSILSPSEIYRSYKESLKSGECIKSGGVGMSYELPRKDIEKFQIVFGKLIKDYVPIIIPNLNYNRWSRYRWVFWMLLIH
jgi:hypothetical protein